MTLVLAYQQMKQLYWDGRKPDVPSTCALQPQLQEGLSPQRCANTPAFCLNLSSSPQLKQESFLQGII